ncbi:MAG: S46 family peptidase [Betaproteobacteria bacterium]
MSVNRLSSARRGHRKARIACALAAALATLAPAHAEEGVWTFDNPPVKALQSKYGFTPSAEWLDALRLSSVRLGGGSGSFVSASGLVLTNHHVARDCLQALSTATDNIVANGFYARTRAEERLCPGMELRRLESMEDVSDKIRAAVKSTTDTQANAERNAAMAALEDRCRESTGLRCEMVTLYRGAAYHLYRYKIWNDVRLVFAPDSRAAEFGGDTDNFVYPRFDLDFAVLRVYENGAPLKPAHFLKWAKKGLENGELVFAAGHPGSTDRLLTLTQVVYDRDVRYPMMLATANRQLKVLQDYAAASPESARRASHNILGTENWLKAMTGEYKALRDPALMSAKTTDEAQLRESFVAAAGQPDPWAIVEVATVKQSRDTKARWEVGYGFGTMFRAAGQIVELANETALPDADRMSEYRASKIPRIVHRLSADEPYYKDLEIARLAGRWQEAAEVLGKDDPFVVRVLGNKTPLEAARQAVDGSQLDQVAVRRKLIEGGKAAVMASTDPLIVLARDVYPMHRRLEKTYEVEVETPTLRAGDALATIRLKSYASDAYPDATFTLRLSFGKVSGYNADGVLMPFQTNFAGLYARSFAFDGQPPFDLSKRWLEKQRDVDLATPLNFVATLDIHGGNSGSPVVGRNGELVGLIFDGNLEALGARYAYTQQKARAIAVDTRAIVQALTKVYGAAPLAAELTGQ